MDEWFFLEENRSLFVSRCCEVNALFSIRERKGIFLVQTASDKKAAGDIAVIGEKRKRRF